MGISWCQLIAVIKVPIHWQVSVYHLDHLSLHFEPYICKVIMHRYTFITSSVFHMLATSVSWAALKVSEGGQNSHVLLYITAWLL
jgi:hypothetical protein